MNWWMKIKIWAKIGVFSIIAVYIFLFSIKNLGTKTELWVFFGQGWTIESSVLLLAVGAFAFGIIFTLMVRTIIRTMSQLREMKRKRAEKEAIAILNRASKLRTRDSRPTGDSTTSPSGSEDLG